VSDAKLAVLGAFQKREAYPAQNVLVLIFRFDLDRIAGAQRYRCRMQPHRAILLSKMAVKIEPALCIEKNPTTSKEHVPRPAAWAALPILDPGISHD
jgi:hypothetical protein